MEEDIKNKTDWFEEIIKVKESPYYFITNYLKIKTKEGELPIKLNCSEKEFNKIFNKNYNDRTNTRYNKTRLNSKQ
jgi:transposase